MGWWGALTSLGPSWVMDGADSGRVGAPKLLERLRAALRTRHYSRRTEEAYVYWVRRLVRSHGLRHPTELR